MGDLVKLMDVCDINMGQSPDSASYNSDHRGLPFFQGNADFGEMSPSVRLWCDAPTKIATAGDLLVSVRAPIGAINVANCQCCIGRGLAALTAKVNVCDPSWLYFALVSRVPEMQKQGTGSTFKAINKNGLMNLSLPKCSLNKQREIANRLHTIRSLCKSRQQQLDILDKLAKSRFIELFGDIIQNNKNWPRRQFDTVATSRLGKMLDAKKQTGRYKFPYLANCNVQWFHFDLAELKEMDFDEEDQKEFELREGDLLVCEGGEIGRCAVWHNEIQPCYFQKAIHRVRCNLNLILPNYLTWWFKISCENNAFQNIAGAKATIAHLPGEKLKKLLVTVPPIGLQKDFALFLGQLDKSKLIVQNAGKCLKKLFEAVNYREDL